MFVKILGLGDFVMALITMFSPVFSQGVILLAAKYLILKGGIFAIMMDKASILDVACGVYLLAVAYGFSWSIATIIVTLFLVQKSAFSFIG